MRKAYLGSADEPPLGVVFEPRSMRSVPDPKYPAMMRAFERLRTKYPYAARNVDRTVGDDKMLGTTQFAEVNVHVPRTIRFNPMLEQLSEQEQDETLEHELTHVGQNANTYGRKPKSVNDLYFNFEAPAYKTASDTDRAATMTEADRDRYLKAVAAEQLRRSRK
jgi:hypothetical protein